MLELSSDEWAALCTCDDSNFVAAVRDDIVRDEPALANDPTLLERLINAYARTKKLGFVDQRAIITFSVCRG